ncbi:MAG: DUF4842 domain-containing protein [Bacteroides sp.]|nr:DUF4842 domain-containing protein [Bacteroides sp.]
MRNFHSFCIVCISCICILFPSCQEEEVYNEPILEQQIEVDPSSTIAPQFESYQAAWLETFGSIDPNHDWSTVKQATANFNLNGNENYSIRIYTHNPIKPSARILVNTTIKGKSSISFDIKKAQEKVYIQVINEQGRSVISHYYPTDNLSISTRDSYIRPRSLGTCNTFVSESKELNHDFNGKRITIQCLENVASQESDKMDFSVLKSILNTDGVLAEANNNLTTLQGQYDKNAEIIVNETGPVAISMLCGGTIFKDIVGYYYYWDSNDLESIINAPKYLLINDATPQSNISCYDTANQRHTPTDGMDITNNWILNEEHNDHQITGKEYQLTYFDEEGNATYNFPKGIHIGFFIIRADLWDMSIFEEYINDFHAICFSSPALNEYYGYYQDPSDAQSGGAINSIIFNYNGITYMGMEDSMGNTETNASLIKNDHDMNDIFFTITGNIVNHQELSQTPPESFIIACEDLGSVYDLDFNDIVFSVSHVRGENKALVTPLASGGILPVWIQYNGAIVGGKEFHELFIIPDNTTPRLPINANALHGYTTKAEPIEITVPTDYSVTQHGFTLLIDQTNTNDLGKAITIGNAINQGNNIELNKNEGSQAPLMLTLPEGWKWPKEEALIYQAYESFKNWTNDQSSSSEWYKDVSNSNLIVE